MSPKLFNILLIVASLVLYFYVVDPLYTGADGVFWAPKDNVKSLKASGQPYTSTINGIPKIMRDAKNMSKEYEVFDEKAKNTIMIMVPTSVDEVKLLSEITEVANREGFALDGLAVKDKKTYFTISFSVKTTYPRFKTLMIAYEKSMRLIALDSVSFNPVKDETEPIKFSVELVTYYMK